MADARHHNHHRDGAAAPSGVGQYDYFLLSLSWSPSYCLTHQEDRAQCSKGYGFVLHGLWPQQENGGYPENCAPDAPLPAAALARAATLFPSPRLMQHEWQRHGSCTGLDARSYFDTADRALAAVKIPALFEAPRSDLSMRAAAIVAAFYAVNPRLPPDALVVACNRAELSEVRVCLSKGLVPIACGRGVRNACPDVALHVPAAR
jgi:ribonuclease T2